VGFDGRTGALEMGVHGVLSKKMELRPQTPNREEKSVTKGKGTKI
jgi:hypothetical protein